MSCDIYLIPILSAITGSPERSEKWRTGGGGGEKKKRTRLMNLYSWLRNPELNKLRPQLSAGPPGSERLLTTLHYT